MQYDIVHLPRYTEDIFLETFSSMYVTPRVKSGVAPAPCNSCAATNTATAHAPPSPPQDFSHLLTDCMKNYKSIKIILASYLKEEKQAVGSPSSKMSMNIRNNNYNWWPFNKWCERFLKDTMWYWFGNIVEKRSFNNITVRDRKFRIVEFQPSRWWW